MKWSQRFLKDVVREQQIFKQRVLVAVIFIVLLLLVLLIRQIELQIVLHEHFVTRAEDNRVKILPIAPTRGLIYSRDGVLLAENSPSFSLDIIPEAVPDIEDTLVRLSVIIDIELEEVERFHKNRKRKRRFDRIPIRFNLTDEEVARFAVNSYQFPGVDINASLARHYPLNQEMSHLIGYVGRINEQELTKLDSSNYAASRHIGKIGIEKQYEDLLHGQVGYQQVEVNVKGRILRVLERTPPVPGVNLHLSIDVGLQKTAYKALEGRRGAIVAIEPATGEVLAMVSVPGFDPNLFVNGISSKKYRDLNTDMSRPLFNRFLLGQYPPGSTIKPLLGLSALEWGYRSAAKETWCPGWFQLEGRQHRYRCWKKHGHGKVNLNHAIVQSCDVFYYSLANDMGIDRLYQSMDSFGFGRKTGVDLPWERSGLMPSRSWKKSAKDLPWYPGETLITGIGQGFMLTTPLQLAQASAIMAQRGKAFKPFVLKSMQQSGSTELSYFRPQPLDVYPQASRVNWQTIIQSMRDVVHGTRGTARRSGQGAKYQFAGKTGTAQVFGIKQDEEYDKENVAAHLKDHALFIAFAPVEQPVIAVAVVIEHGGSGSSSAAPIARKLFDYYLSDGKSEAGEDDAG